MVATDVQSHLVLCSPVRRFNELKMLLASTWMFKKHREEFRTAMIIKFNELGVSL